MVRVRNWTDEQEREAVRVLERPLRVKALDLLMDERLTVEELSQRLGQRDRVMRFHCRELIKARIVEEFIEGQVRRLRPTPLGLYAREWV
jgi:DNA-binding transcriptional ArsR family regulator